MQPDELSISQMSSRYEVTFRTLRFYEDRGLLQPVRRGTARFYTARDRIRLELVLKGKRLGFTLLEIERLVAAGASADAPLDADVVRHLSPQQVKDRLAQLERQRDEVEGSLAELRKALASHEARKPGEPRLLTAS